MISFEEFTLRNGLHVIVHQDYTTPIAAVNLLYNVGARDEEESKTGFAHLFEHLMFGGSKNIPSYDAPLQKVGGENNAFTNNDITNYYVTLPVSNIETAFWLESDRMLELSFDPKALEVQRKVVIEEFKQRYLNQPYGDAWLRLRPLAYKTHPYRWATIGKDISHIENATMEDVKDFFYRFYRPNNAILVVAGAISTDEVKKLTEKWFGDIPAGKTNKKKYNKEARQTKARFEETEANVPLDSVYKVYHMPSRSEQGYYVADLLSDVLGRGKSSRLYTQLVKDKNLFSTLNAYVTGSTDEGLLVIHGNVNKGIDIKAANKAIEEITEDLIYNTVDAKELEKVKNKSISTIVFSETELLNRAMSLAYFASLGNVNLINQEVEKIQEVSAFDLKKMAKEVLRPDNCSTLFYKSKDQ